MRADQLQVLRDGDVALDEVGALSVRAQVGQLGVLGVHAAGPPVADDGRAGDGQDAVAVVQGVERPTALLVDVGVVDAIAIRRQWMRRGFITCLAVANTFALLTCDWLTLNT